MVDWKWKERFVKFCRGRNGTLLLLLGSGVNGKLGNLRTKRTGRDVSTYIHNIMSINWLGGGGFKLGISRSARRRRGSVINDNP